MKFSYLFLLAPLQIFTNSSEFEALQKSKLISKKKRIEARIRILRNKIDLKEANSSESAKFYQLLEDEKKIKEQIKAFDRS